MCDFTGEEIHIIKTALKNNREAFDIFMHKVCSINPNNRYIYIHEKDDGTYVDIEGEHYRFANNSYSGRDIQSLHFAFDSNYLYFQLDLEDIRVDEIIDYLMSKNVTTIYSITFLDASEKTLNLVKRLFENELFNGRFKNLHRVEFECWQNIDRLEDICLTIKRHFCTYTEFDGIIIRRLPKFTFNKRCVQGFEPLICVKLFNCFKKEDIMKKEWITHETTYNINVNFKKEETNIITVTDSWLNGFLYVNQPSEQLSIHDCKKTIYYNGGYSKGLVQIKMTIEDKRGFK